MDKRDSGQVLTVLGPVAAHEIGRTSMHEHLVIDLSPWLESPATAEEAALAEAPVTIDLFGTLQRDPIHLNRDNAVLDDPDLAVRELLRAAQSGARTVVDLTTRGLRPDPSALREISRRSGVHVVAGSGFYIHASHPEWMETLGVSDLERLLMADIEEGIDGSGIRAGILGELGTSAQVLPCERRVLQAAARVQVRTGVALTVHTYPWSQCALEILDDLEAEGADISRVILAHLDSGPIDLAFQRRVLERGAVISYDGFGKEWYVDRDRRWFPRDTERSGAIRTLIDEGWIRSLVLATDACVKIQLSAFGGWGYQHLFGNVVPLLEGHGLTGDDIETLLTVNPARLLRLTMT